MRMLQTVCLSTALLLFTIVGSCESKTQREALDALRQENQRLKYYLILTQMDFMTIIEQQRPRGTWNFHAHREPERGT